MGASKSTIKKNLEKNSNKTEQKIKKEVVFETQSNPMTKSEIDELYLYEPATCKIRFKTLLEGKKVNCLGTGFFCEINERNIPFNKALFTNNHVLDKIKIKINKHIEFEYLGKNFKIEMTKERKAFTNKTLDYTCVQILDTDNIKKFFSIDKTIFNYKNSLINKEIFILQYPSGILSHHSGKILRISDNIIEHSVPTQDGSSGSPLIKRYNMNFIVGIHFGAEKKELEKLEQNEYSLNNEFKFNLATPFDVIIEDIIDKLSKNIDNSENIEYRNTINLIYNKDEGDDNCTRIFGQEFVKNNKNNITLIINSKKSQLIEECELEEGSNNIKMIILKQLTNLGNMFDSARALENIEELRYLNTEKVNNFSCMFRKCSSLSDIKSLEKKYWNVSNGNDFSEMFYRCSSLSDIISLQNWNVSNGNNFSEMFSYCSSLAEIKSLQNWNVSNGSNFSCMFGSCSSLSDINSLQNWNVSNGKNFSAMFSYCSSLSNIKAIQNWNVSNGKNFSAMFYKCSSLSDIKSLENWIVSNGNDFSAMFYKCSSLSDIKSLENWKVSNGNNFSEMFSYCSSLSDIKSLHNWNVSNGKNFSAMFYSCSSLSDIKSLQNWNFSDKKYFSQLLK